MGQELFDRNVPHSQPRESWPIRPKADDSDDPHVCTHTHTHTNIYIYTFITILILLLLKYIIVLYFSTPLQGSMAASIWASEIPHLTTYQQTSHFGLVVKWSCQI